MNAAPGGLRLKGIDTSRLALGCSRLGSLLTPLDRKGCISLLTKAYELGIRHFDTADIYGQGDSERYVGEALGRHRGEVCIATKAGQLLSAKQKIIAKFKGPLRWVAARQQGVRQSVTAQRARELPRCFEPDYIERALQASLKRLGTDHADIFYLHSPDPGVLRDELLFERLARMREHGMFRVLGVSCDDPELACAAAGHVSVDIVQFAIGDHDTTKAILDTMGRANQVAVLRGFFSDHRGDRPALGLAERIAATSRLPAVGGMIVGTTSTSHLIDNVNAFRSAMSEAL